MRRIKLFTSDFQLVTDRVEIPKFSEWPRVVTYGLRTFTYLQDGKYIEVFAVAAIDFPNLSGELFGGKDATTVG